MRKDKRRDDRRMPLLMTASVSTRGMRFALFSNEEREDMYVEALTYYIEHLLPRSAEQTIVFAENSGWDLDRIKRRLPNYDEDRIEFISLHPDEFDISKGKGYNELLLINKTIELSEHISKAGAFFKVTGRYPIHNIAYLMRDASHKVYDEGYSFYCDIKDHKLYDWLRLGWCGHAFEARLWGGVKDFYKQYIAEKYVECDDSKDRYVEGVLFDFIKQPHDEKISIRFKREPRFGGKEGSNIQVMSFTADHRSLKSRLKMAVGDMIRTLTPWFKF